VADPLGKQLRDEVEKRRDAGRYPPGVEEELDHLYERVVARPASVDTASLHRLVAELATPFYASDADATSRVPGGRLVHRWVARLRRRHEQQLIGQLNDFAEAVKNCLEALLKSIESTPTHDHPDLLGQVETLEVQVAELRRRLNQ
jgi:hypothetical protein